MGKPQTPKIKIFIFQETINIGAFNAKRFMDPESNKDNQLGGLKC